MIAANAVEGRVGSVVRQATEEVERRTRQKRNMAVANIGPEERWKRLVGGFAVLVVGLGIAVAMILAGLDRWWRTALFIPFWLGALGIFQAWEKT